MLNPLANAILIKILSPYGPKAVAAFGAVTRIEAFSLIGIYAFCSIITPFVGQNFGAKKFIRIQQGMSFGYYFAMNWGLVIAFFLIFLSSQIAYLFSSDPLVIQYITWYCYLVPCTFACLGISEMNSSGLYGLGLAKKALSLTITRLFILMLPFSFILSYWWNISGVFAARSISHILICLLVFGSSLAHLEKYRNPSINRTINT